jgi:uncharacterized protein (TIGR02996 family)
MSALSANRNAFLAAIRANPDDDLVRMVFADWLDEHDEPEFAGFIRFQIARASQPVANPHARRLEELFESSRPGSPVKFLALPANLSAVCRRGLIAELSPGVPDYLDWADRIGPYAPRLSVHLRTMNAESGPPVEGRGAWMAEVLDRLARCPWLATWSELAAPNYGIASPALARLVASPHVSGLQRLYLSSNWLGPDPNWVVEASLTALRELNLHCNLGNFERNRSLSAPRPGDPVLAALAAAPWATELESLDYGGNTATAEGARALSTSAILSRLRSLRLNYNPIGDDGLRALAETTTLTSLTDLDVSECRGLTPDGIAALVRSPLMPRLTSLVLGGPQVTDGVIRDLAASPQSTGLTRLSLWYQTAATLAGARAILDSPFLSRLQVLTLGQILLDDDAVARLADPQTLPRLERLVIALPETTPTLERLAALLKRRFGDKVMIQWQSPEAEIEEHAS